MAVTTLVLAAVAVALFFILLALMLQIHNSRGAKFLRRFPQPPSVPILGSVLELNVSNEEMTQRFMFDWPRIYGPRFGIQLGPRVYFTSTQHTDAEKLLTSSVHIKKGDEYRFLASWLGEGLLTSSGQKWFRRRKLLTPSFHFKILEEFLHVFNSQSQIFVDILREDSEGGRKVLEICQYVTRCTLDTICETAMGKQLHVQRIKDSPYVRAVYGINGLIQHRAVRPWLYPDLLWNLSPSGRKQQEYLKILHGFTNSVIQERKRELRHESKTERKVEETETVFMGSKRRTIAFLDLLLQHQAENPGELTDEDIREEADTFMFEGHDTTAASLSWTIHLLGAYPQYQERAFEEIQSILGDDKARPITANDLSQMKFLECCIKESLRLYPSVPLIDRYLTEDLVLDEYTTIPKGCNFPLFLFQVHRDPEIYPEPEEFKPERFFPENSVGRHPFAYVPFSAGPRNCIGQKFAIMEEKVIMADLLRNFRIESLDKRESIVMMTEVILRPRDGLRVRLVPR